MAWKEEKTLKAVAQYLRLVVGGVLLVILLYMFVNERVDLETVVKTLLGLLAVDKVGMFVATKSDNAANS